MFLLVQVSTLLAAQVLFSPVVVHVVGVVKGISKLMQ